MEIESIFKLPVKGVFDTLESLLRGCGYASITRDDAYLYGKGDVPVVLVAHADTAHKNLPTLVLHDTSKGILWSPTGLGADDRAGIIAIAKVLNAGYKPHVLITDGEERGGIGAKKAAETGLVLDGVKYMIEIDRQGNDEAVFYDDDQNGGFVDYICSFGWKHAQGTFSDIAILAPAWGIAGVNVSAGYYQNHTTAEYLVLPHLENTIEKICKMLDDTENAPVFMHTPRRVVSLPSCWTIDVDLDLDYLADFYGCSPERLEDLMLEHYDELTLRAQQAVFDYIDYVLDCNVYHYSSRREKEDV